MSENTTYTVEQIEQTLLDNADFEEADDPETPEEKRNGND